MSKLLRLDKFLSENTNLSRSEAKSAIKKSKICVNKIIITEPEFKIDITKDEILYDNMVINHNDFLYYMLNKPAGVISATKDNNDKTVIDIIKDKTKNDLFPVGRLDKDTEGLLIITNDGALAHDLLSPNKHVDKTYYAKIDGLVNEDDIKKFNEGLLLKDGLKTKPSQLKILSTDIKNNSSEIEITIKEGKYHQVKRMFACCGKHVSYLKRIRMGNIALDDNLPIGQYRLLTEEEVRRLKNE